MNPNPSLETPTEDTYTAELVSQIKTIGGKLGFDAEVQWKTPSGKPDIKLYYKNTPVAIIEVKRPDIPLSDPGLHKQALRYAEWYRQKRGIKYYAIHNMKYLLLYKYAGKQEKEKTKQLVLDMFYQKKKGMKLRTENWTPVSELPFEIIPEARSIYDYKKISTDKEAKENLKKFLMAFKELLDGKTIDLSTEVIHNIRTYIEKAAKDGVPQLYQKYKESKEIQDVFEEWLKERGIKKPKNDVELKQLLELLLREQLYTFSMRVLFYFVLQSLDPEMAVRLTEDLTKIKPEDPELFSTIFDSLFEYAVKKSGDFEEVFRKEINGRIDPVDRLPFMSKSLFKIEELIDYLAQIRWSELNVDLIGRIFEGLIHEERRHLLGQHFTDAQIVDLIVANTVKEPKKLIDPACGSGTFLVRTLNYWKIQYPKKAKSTNIYDLVEGVDIDRLATMLSKINLYIQALERIKKGETYLPKVHNEDFFKLVQEGKIRQNYGYVVANPPYTRQEEMALAYYNPKYKQFLNKSIEDIPDWSEKASIYAYFMVGGAKILSPGGRFGFIVENSWTNADYGVPLQRWMLDNLNIELIMESLTEKWFEDAEVITNIIIAEKKSKPEQNPDNLIRFVYFKKKLNELFGYPPVSSDYVANQRYYERISEFTDNLMKKGIKKGSEYMVYENDSYKLVVVRESLLRTMTKWNVFKAPKKYLELYIDFLSGNSTFLTYISNVLELGYGLKTNGNELFYLPSKHWTFKNETNEYLELKHNNRIIRISKKYLRPVIRTRHLSNSPYLLSAFSKRKKEDYVLWIPDTTKVNDPGAKEYLEWCKVFVIESYKTEKRFPTLFQKMGIDENELEKPGFKPSEVSPDPKWLKLSDTAGGRFLFRNAVNKNYAIVMNGLPEAQVDLRLYYGKIKPEYSKVDDRVIFASLNSVITYLGMELLGRTNLGQGALDIKVVDYKQIPILDPMYVQEKLQEQRKLDRFLTLVDRLLKRKPKNIEEEAKDRTRMEMEELLLGTIGLTKKEIKELYNGLVQLAKFRTEKTRKG